MWLNIYMSNSRCLGRFISLDYSGLKTKNLSAMACTEVNKKTKQKISNSICLLQSIV